MLGLTFSESVGTPSAKRFPCQVLGAIAVLMAASAGWAQPEDRTSALVAKAVDLVAERRYRQALVQFESVDASYAAESWETNYYLAFCRLRLGRYAEATAAAETAVALDPQNDYGVALLAYCDLANGRLEEGIAQAREAVQLAPSSLLRRKLLGLAYTLSGEGALAISYLRAAAEGLDDLLSCYALAQAYRLAGRESEARQALTDARTRERRLEFSGPDGEQSKQVMQALDEERTQHLLVRLPKLPEIDRDAVLECLEQAYVFTSRTLNYEVTEPLEVVVYPGLPTFQRILRGTMVRVEATHGRLLLPSVSFILSAKGRGIPKIGMLMLLVNRMAGDNLPYWLGEGIGLATMSYGPDTPLVYARRLEESRPVSLRVLEILPYEKMYASRTIPYFATKYLMKNFGPRKLGEFAMAIGDGAETVEQALVQTYGLDYADLTAAWQNLAQKTLDEHRTTGAPLPLDNPTKALVLRRHQKSEPRGSGSHLRI